MTDASFVRGLERFEDLPGDHQRLFDRNWPTSKSLGERVAFDQLEDEELDLPRVGEFEDTGDVRMIEGGDGLSFTMKPRHALGVARVLLGEDLQRDLAVQ